MFCGNGSEKPKTAEQMVAEFAGRTITAECTDDEVRTGRIIGRDPYDGQLLIEDPESGLMSAGTRTVFCVLDTIDDVRDGYFCLVKNITELHPPSVPQCLLSWCTEPPRDGEGQRFCCTEHWRDHAETLEGPQLKAEATQATVNLNTGAVSPFIPLSCLQWADTKKPQQIACQGNYIEQGENL